MADKVSVDISIEDKAAQRAIRKFENSLERAGRSAEQSISRLDIAMGAFAGNVATKVAGFALGFLKDSIGETINAAQRQEDAINSLNAALRQSGEFTQSTSLDLQEFASQLQSVTKFGDEAILEQLAFAKSMGATTEQAKQIVAAATDMSAALNVDFNSAVRNITKTLGGLKGELGESISELGNLTAEQLKAGDAIGLIASKFSGQASAAVNTFSGRTQQLSNVWGDFLENVGFFITKSPLVQSAISEITEAIGALNDLIGEDTNEEKIKSTGDRIIEVNSQIKEIKAEIQEINAEGGLFADFKINAKTKELHSLNEQMRQLSLEQERQRLIQKAAIEEQARAEQSKPIPDPMQDPRVRKEILVNAELKRIDEERKLAEEEGRLKEKEIQGLATEEDLQRIRDIELQKMQIKADFEEQKTALIQNEDERRFQEQKDAANRELEFAKIKSKQLVDVKKMQLERERQINQAMLSTTQNFIGAGLALAKQGSAEQKALLIAQSTMSTWAAATQALKAPPGPPWSFALAASTVALGLANVAKISRQSFQHGGVVGGFQGASMGPDNTNANVRTGEMILNGPQQRNLFEIAQTGGGTNEVSEKLDTLISAVMTQPVIVEVDSVEIARSVRNARELGMAV